MSKKELDDNLIVVFGNFNVVHPGHARLFSFAKGHNGKLIVAVFSDKIAGEDAFIEEQLRLENVKIILLLMKLSFVMKLQPAS